MPGNAETPVITVLPGRLPCLSSPPDDRSSDRCFCCHNCGTKGWTASAKQYYLIHTISKLGSANDTRGSPKSKRGE
jgi:hypothetical protein